MSLRDQIDQFLADINPTGGLTDAIDDRLNAGGFDGLDPGSLADALLHYADTSPLHVADALSSFLVEQSDIPLDDAPLDGPESADETYSNAHLDASLLSVFGLGAFADDAAVDDDVDASTDGDDADLDDELDDDFDDGFDDFDLDDGFDADDGFIHDDDPDQPFEAEAAEAVEAIDFEEPVPDEIIDP
ncbi:MAG: hypothetical protein R2706_15870 [Acidimicrobiales bacterium]